MAITGLDNTLFPVGPSEGVLQGPTPPQPVEEKPPLSHDELIKKQGTSLMR